MADKITMIIHHGGKFTESFGLCRNVYKHYLGGKVSEFTNIDVDFLSYFEISDYVKKDLGYNGLCKLYYKSIMKSMSTGLKLLYNDDQINDLIAETEGTKAINIYVDHLDDEQTLEPVDNNVPYEVMANLDDTVDDRNDVGDQSHDKVVGEDHGIDKVVGEGDPTGESEDGGYDVELDLDDLSDVNSMEHCTDDEGDEELQEIRKKLLDMKKEISKIRKQNDALRKSKVTHDRLHTTGDVNVGTGLGVSDSSDEGENNDNAKLDAEESEPLGSSDYDTAYESDEEDSNNCRVNYPVFNPLVEIHKIKFEVGLRFSNPKQLKEAVRNYAVANCLALKFKVNKPQHVQVVCKEGCPWTLWASWMTRERSFQIKTLHDVHKCPRQERVRMATSTWLSKMYGDRIRENPTWKCKEFKKDVSDTYKMTVTRLQCYRAKQKALGEVENGLIEHYSHLRSYAREIIKSDNRNTVKLSVHRQGPDEPATFKRMYICFHALKKGWKEGCRPILGLDGSFLKSYCCGEILAAVGRDSNNQMFPVAWAVVEVENTDSWTWFLEILKDDLELDKQGLTLITGIHNLFIFVVFITICFYE